MSVLFPYKIFTFHFCDIDIESPQNFKLTVDCDVDGVGLSRPDALWDVVDRCTGELGILVLLGHLVLQGALDRVEVLGLPGQGQDVYFW